ncbi:MAG: ABC transporter ATP-binding protein, partial [Polyangia bacterium]
TMIPLVMMTVLSNMWAAGLVSAARVQEVLGTVPRIVDAPDAADLSSASGAGRVVFDGVSFAYDADRNGATAAEGNAAVLSALTFHAQPGQTIAILGATGAGKSTLVNLIPRFYDVTAGAVRVGAEQQDVRLLKQDSLLDHIAVVPQESLLFSGTIRDNIRYGRPDASDGQVRAAAEAAQADEFIVRLPGGYDARVEARGANLSGGQRQRLAIARALLLEPAILILDDSTSAVDVETETRLQDALASTAAAGRARTTFVVAQRISTVLKADQILVLEHGRIVASGTHQELMQSSPVYQEIYESQLGVATEGREVGRQGVKVPVWSLPVHGDRLLGGGIAQSAAAAAGADAEPDADGRASAGRGRAPS